MKKLLIFSSMFWFIFLFSCCSTKDNNSYKCGEKNTTDIETIKGNNVHFEKIIKEDSNNFYLQKKDGKIIKMKKVKTPSSHYSIKPLTPQSHTTFSLNETQPSAILHQPKPGIIIHQQNSQTRPIKYVIPSEDNIKGRLNYLIQDTMYVDTMNYVELTVSKNVPIETIINNTSTFHGHQGNVVEREIRITPKMKAELVDPTKKCFQISSIGDIDQSVEDNSVTTWRWSVIPLIKGNNKLTIIVSIYVVDPNIKDYVPKSIIVYDGEIKVFSLQKEPSFINKSLSFFGKHWDKFLFGMIIPFTCWIFIQFILPRLRKKKEN